LRGLLQIGLDPIRRAEDSVERKPRDARDNLWMNAFESVAAAIASDSTRSPEWTSAMATTRCCALEEVGRTDNSKRTVCRAAERAWAVEGGLGACARRPG
jgi:hypothetical protein